MREDGVTLVELLVVITIAAILVGIAVPGYQALVSVNRIAAATNDLVTALHLARSEAVKRGRRVTVCKTDGTAAMLPACAPAVRWQDGWLVFVDGQTPGVIDDGDTLLHVRIGDGSGLTVSASNFTTYVSYRPDGVSRAPNGLANGSLRLCLAGVRRDVIVNTAGRIRIAAGAC